MNTFFPSRFRIKICGMTRIEDARCAVRVGVDALGFIFHEKSPRAVRPEQAARMIAELPPFVAAVGVFVSEDLDTVAAIARRCGLSHVQLHGSETSDYCRNLAERLPGCRLLKALRVGLRTSASEVQPYYDHVQGLVLDTFDNKLAGGTGTVFDWRLIQALDLQLPFLLAGGLGPDNVGVALGQVRPYGVDANSVLEDAPGQKNHALIRRFVSEVRIAEAQQ